MGGEKDQRFDEQDELFSSRITYPEPEKRNLIVNHSLKNLLKETVLQLKGAARRRFMAQTVLELGYGGQSLAAQELGWNRTTIRKGIKELKSGITCIDNNSAKGRKKAEEHLPNLLEDIKNLVDSQSQTDPTFKSKRLYTRLSAAQVRKQLIEQFSYNNQDLPTEETIRVKLNNLVAGLEDKRLPHCVNNEVYSSET